MAQLYFYYSAMNAGKSTSLLQSAHNYQERGMRVLLYTAAIDDRFGQRRISSRIGLAAAAEVFDADTDFFHQVSRQHQLGKLACVLVDEAQFLKAEQVDALAQVVDELDIAVLCYGLRTDFQGQLFSGSARLLAIADKLSELKTVCHCGRKATMTVRHDEQGQVLRAGEQVQVGGNEHYESMCRRHYHEAIESGCLPASGSPAR